jgi:hypothetical protein
MAISQWRDKYPEFAEACEIGRTARLYYVESELVRLDPKQCFTSIHYMLANIDSDEWKRPNDLSVKLSADEGLTGAILRWGGSPSNNTKEEK